MHGAQQPLHPLLHTLVEWWVVRTWELWWEESVRLVVGVPAST